jgi:hypothetical protein
MWLRILLRLYPADFRDEMGDAIVNTYRERCRNTLRRRGMIALMGVWLRALWDSLRNGIGERVRPAASWRRSGNWGRDMEIAFRRLVRAPMFMLAMVVTLTVGLGAFAVVYAVVQKVLLSPMAYERPDDLYFVWRDYGKIFDLKRGWLAGTDVAELQKSGGVIEEAAALISQQTLLSTRAGADPIEIAAMVASPNVFDLLGVRPALGRGFTRDEVGPTRAPVIVLTHQLWSRLGADRSILGKTVWLTGDPFTVIGVMPHDFSFARHASLGPPQRPAEAYTTFAVNLAETHPQAGSYAGLIRARRGTPPEQVAAAVSAVGRAVDARDFKNGGLSLYPIGLKPDLVSSVRPALMVLGFAGVFLVLVLMVKRRHAAARACSETRAGVRGVAGARRERRRIDARNDSRGWAARGHWRHRWRHRRRLGNPRIRRARSTRSSASRFDRSRLGCLPPSSSAPAPCSDCSPRSCPRCGRHAHRSRRSWPAARSAAAVVTNACDGRWWSRRSRSR